MIYIGKVIDLTGQRFGRLTVLERAKEDYISPSGKHQSRWVCKCDCGNIKIVRCSNLKNGHTKSCGCLSIENSRNQLMKIHNKFHSQYNRKSNDYDLTGDYGIGYTLNKDSNGNNYFLFDLDDFIKIKDYYWRFNKQDYLVATGIYGSENQYKLVRLHLIIMDKKDGFVIDHINHNKFDNRKNNLRVCTYSQNMQNRTPQNIYGVSGIHYYKSRKKYVASLTKNKKTFHLGYYDNLEDAITARKEAEEKYFGEYSYDNSMNINKENNIKGEIKMTNKEYLFHLDDYELAEYLVTFVRQDSDGNDIYADPSGIEWFIFEDAVEATIEWLNKEVNE